MIQRRPSLRRLRRGVSVLWLIVIMPLAVTGLLFTIETGRLWLARAEVEDALEAGALAAVIEWAEHDENAPHSTLIPREIGAEFAASNTVLGQAFFFTDANLNYVASSPGNNGNGNGNCCCGNNGNGNGNNGNGSGNNGNGDGTNGNGDGSNGNNGNGAGNNGNGDGSNGNNGNGCSCCCGANGNGNNGNGSGNNGNGDGTNGNGDGSDGNNGNGSGNNGNGDGTNGNCCCNNGNGNGNCCCSCSGHWNGNENVAIDGEFVFGAITQIQPTVIFDPGADPHQPNHYYAVLARSSYQVPSEYNFGGFTLGPYFIQAETVAMIDEEGRARVVRIDAIAAP